MPHEAARFSNIDEANSDRSMVAKYSAIMETAVDAIITIREDGVIESVNPAACRMFGYPMEALVGSNVRILMPAPHSAEHDGYLRKYRETGQAAIIGVGRRVSGVRKDGTQFPLHLAVTEFHIGDKQFFSGIIRDLTELDQAQTRLLQSARLAAIGQMVTGLAHESRNALQRAQACLDMLSLELEGQEDLQDLSRRATNALQDLHRLYEEVRSYAAPIHLEFREVNLRNIWRKEWENLAAVRTSLDIRLTESVECDDAVCEVDVHRIEQVFRNILENAIHACGSDGAIQVHCCPVSINGQEAIRIEFIDDGTGLTSDAAQHIFEPFFTTKQKGTGLGMAIVRRIIDAHCGEISARPGSDRGTVISVVLPRRIAANEVRNGVRSSSSVAS
ncbi:MAG: PAS domain S-box protein [Planctomycetaceae bacterium]|nr:PAS domain S-box protein [Planctomycetaceae bacterium]